MLLYELSNIDVHFRFFLASTGTLVMLSIFFMDPFN